jgi:hypothetical protein
MEKAQFNNEFYYWSVIIFLSGLFIWNLTIFVTGSLTALMPLTIVSIVLFLFSTKNKFSRIAIMIWSVVFLIIASGLQLIGRLMVDSVDNFIAFDLTFYIKVILSLIAGLAIFIYGKNTIEIITIEE